MNAKSPLYLGAVAIGKEYLGPAGERFIRRQIEMHLGIHPEDLQKKDITKLVEWSKLAFAMLTDDEEYVEAFSYDLGELRKLKVGKSNVSR